MDLEVGEQVEIIKMPDGSSIDMTGYKGIVDRRVSGGWVVKARLGMFGEQEIVVGSIDWHEYVKKVVIKVNEPSPLPKALEQWYHQTKPYIGRE